ncbi:hypothetical protein KP509_21G005500 [Ceratopteris richardii]|uniref:Uncharacterized protein n=1 Tax=Ceratopteris richardii TaxID=49495 RepID=A0A8T2S953_CERRI|nr:hypothetical protein KP509_21G005500 [Ceratopteris richardii]
MVFFLDILSTWMNKEDFEIVCIVSQERTTTLPRCSILCLVATSPHAGCYSSCCTHTLQHIDSRNHGDARYHCSIWSDNFGSTSSGNGKIFDAKICPQIDFRSNYDDTQKKFQARSSQSGRKTRISYSGSSSAGQHLSSESDIEEENGKNVKKGDDGDIVVEQAEVHPFHGVSDLSNEQLQKRNRFGWSETACDEESLMMRITDQNVEESQHDNVEKSATSHENLHTDDVRRFKEAFVQVDHGKMTDGYGDSRPLTGDVEKQVKDICTEVPDERSGALKDGDGQTLQPQEDNNFQKMEEEEFRQDRGITAEDYHRRADLFERSAEHFKEEKFKHEPHEQ